MGFIMFNKRMNVRQLSIVNYGGIAMHPWRSCSFALLTLLLTVNSYSEEEGKNETAIREKAKSYEQAYNRGDSKALAALWSETAEYINPVSGEVVSGREALEQEFDSVFQENNNPQIEIKIDSIEFPNNHQAVETGTAIVKGKDGEINQTAYKAIYEKQNEEWLLTQVREADYEEPPSQYEHLKDLEWLIGEWEDKDEDVIVKTKVQWDKYKNFLTQEFSVATEGKSQLEGKQIIAWDPINEKIRSWVFDSDGGFGEGSWKKKNGSWVVEASQTLADGTRASAINVYTPINHDQYKWESTGREIDGEILPNFGPVNVVRIK